MMPRELDIDTIEKLAKDAARHCGMDWQCGDNPTGNFSNEVVIRPLGEFPHGEWIADIGASGYEGVTEKGMYIASMSPRTVLMMVDEIRRLRKLAR